MRAAARGTLAWLLCGLWLARANRTAPASVRRPGRPRRAAPADGRAEDDFLDTRFAMIVSGQLSRFTYQDAFARLPGGLRALACGRLRGCTVKVDVHVVLQVAGAVSAWQGSSQFEDPTAPQRPPYHRPGHEDEDFKGHFYGLGANLVSSQYISEAALKKMDLFTKRQLDLSLRGDRSDEEWEATLRRLPKWDRRWPAHFRMFFLRHVAFSQALKWEQHLGIRYTHFLYVREDNAFLGPSSSSLVHLARLLERNGTEVAWDSHCLHDGMSDKAFFAKRVAAEHLWGSGLEEYLKTVILWMDVAIRTMNIMTDPLCTETALMVLVRFARLKFQAADLNRTEVRYTAQEGPQPCVHEKYYDCTAQPSRAFRACPGAWYP